MIRKRICFSLIVLGFLSSGNRVVAQEPPPVIVIDPGHGGKDPGAVSKKTREKAVVLQIAKKLSAQLKKSGAEVHLTRSGDRFLELEDRNRLANQKKCDLFLSLHANSSKNRQAEGIEIYYLNKATDQAARRLAARENRGARKKMAAEQEILSDLIQTAVTEESAELASQLKQHLQRKLKGSGVKEVEVKTALFYVLVGAKCPSLLIETGFVTHPRESKRLRDPKYQERLVGALAEGVVRYLSKTQAGGNL